MYQTLPVPIYRGSLSTAMNARGARTTCLALHTVLVLGHIAVVCIWANEAENALVVSRSRADNINQYISLISQGFIVVCLYRSRICITMTHK